MPVITFLPARKTLDVPPGTELLAAIRQAGLEVDAPCGGKGTCGKCLVQIRDGVVDPSASLGILPREVVGAGGVLACRTHTGDAPLTVELPPVTGRAGGRITGGDETALVNQARLPDRANYEPLAIRRLFRVPPPQPEDGLSDLDRLTRVVQRECGPDPVLLPLSVLRTLAAALRTRDGEITATVIRADREIHIIHIEPGNHVARLYGIAVDIGTTTIAVQLVDLVSGAILLTRSEYNAQVSCGLDVISRINYARRPERLEELRTRVLHTVNQLIRQTAEARQILPHEICNAVLSGNTTMLHLLLGLPPEQIRLEPYVPTLLQPPYLTAAETGIEIHPESWIYFSPCVGSYVGGDITAGVLCTDLCTDTAEINLFLDIGTNGEIVLGNRDFLMTCACSAGPAFEGGGIDCGMRAATGAIDRVTVDAASGVARYETVGGATPMGICGSA